MAGNKGFITLVPEGSPHEVEGERSIILPGISLAILTTRVIELTSWTLKGLNDPFWRLYVPISGTAKVWTGPSPEQQHQFEPGQAWLIPPHTTFYSEIPAPFHKWYVHFTLGRTGDRAMPGIYQVNLNAQMQAALQGLEENQSALFTWRSASLVSEALQQLPEEVWTKRNLDSRIERAMDFMHTNLVRKLTSADVARAAGLSVRNLNHLFHQQVSMSPMRVLLDFRLDKACQLLRHSDDSIDQVADDCGFPNRYYFSRMLKQHRGTTPAAYRRGNV